MQLKSAPLFCCLCVLVRGGQHFPCNIIQLVNQAKKKKFHVFTRYTALHRSVLHASLHRCSSTNKRTKNSFNQHANTLHIIKHNQYSSRWSANTKNSLHMWKYREINKQKKMEQRAQWQDLQANTSAEDMCWRSCSTCKPWCCNKCSSWLHEMFKKANS